MVGGRQRASARAVRAGHAMVTTLLIVGVVVVTMIALRFGD
jgi:hypothetical protein